MGQVPNWRELAATVRQHDAAPARSISGLPASIDRSLALLKILPPPTRLEHPHYWRGVVDDALSIADEGWAAIALACGWSVADLFGVGPRDDWEFAGLAVWLNGRSIVTINAEWAIAGEGKQRFYFVRGSMGHGTHPTVTPVLLWEFGR
jgi:hypothetical protein